MRSFSACVHLIIPTVLSEGGSLEEKSVRVVSPLTAAIRHRGASSYVG